MANADAAKDQETLQSQFKKMLNKALSGLRKDLAADFNREIDKLADDLDKKLKNYSRNRNDDRAAQIDRSHHLARSTSCSWSNRYNEKRYHRNQHIAHHHHRRSNSRQRRRGESSQSRDSSRSSGQGHSPRRSSSTRRSIPSSSEDRLYLVRGSFHGLHLKKTKIHAPILRATLQYAYHHHKEDADTVMWLVLRLLKTYFKIIYIK